MEGLGSGTRLDVRFAGVAGTGVSTGESAAPASVSALVVVEFETAGLSMLDETIIGRSRLSLAHPPRTRPAIVPVNTAKRRRLELRMCLSLVQCTIDGLPSYVNAGIS
jgi:hypothetical protein